MRDFVLANPRCALFASMGSGKTRAVLEALHVLDLIEPGPALVVAPLRVAASVWPEEARKWGLPEVVPIVGTAAERAVAMRRTAQVYSINYENVPWLVKECEASGAWPYSTVVADESTRLKGFRLRQGTMRAKALSRAAHTTATRWVNLTGTPAPNGLADLWGQQWFIDAGRRLGRSFHAFESRWFAPHPSGFGIVPLPSAQGEIQALLSDVCMTVDAKAHFDIREPIVSTLYVDLPPKARKLYRDMERKMFAEVEGHDVEAFNAAARTLKCLQLANGAVYVDESATEWCDVHDAKLQALDSIIEEAAGAPVLVAYNFRSDLARLQRAFPQGRALDTSPQTLRAWNAGEVPLLFAHPASAGHGLNLQDGGNILVFFGLNWNLEEHQQIIERIGPTRQAQAGHDRPVYVYRIAARGTVDELVLKRLETKASVQQLILDAMKQRRCGNERARLA